MEKSLILVDIQIPMLDKVLDFELDEESETGKLIEDISVLIAQQEHLICKNVENMCLYVLGQEEILEKGKSLKQQGVRAGDRLILF